jgi:MFS family permease
MTDDRRPEPQEARSGLARAADDRPLTAKGLVDAIGGPLGIVESVLPPLLFVVYYQVVAIRSAPHPVDRPAPLVLSALFVLYRLLRHQRPGGAISGAVLVGVSAALVLVTGDANTNYLPGFFINAAYGLAFLVSVLVGRPLVGVVTGLLTSDAGWRGDRALRRAATWLSLLWVLLFAVRLAVELPLYFAGDKVVELGIARIVLGLPLYSIVLVVTVLVVQALRRRRAA